MLRMKSITKAVATGCFKVATVSVIFLSIFFTTAVPTSHLQEASVGRHEIFNLSGRVTENSVSGLISILETARAEDTVTIYINSPGGFVKPGMNVLKAMENSKARHIEAVVTGMAASMAEGIATKADHVTMNYGSRMMFHFGGAGSYKFTGADKTSRDIGISTYVVLLDGFMKTQVGALLHKADWKTIDDGSEVWLTDVEYRQRGGDHFSGRYIKNVYLQQLIDFIASDSEGEYGVADIEWVYEK